MWNGAGSVSPNDATHMCGCCWCVAKRGMAIDQLLPQNVSAMSAQIEANEMPRQPPGYVEGLVRAQLRDGYLKLYPDNELTQERAKAISDTMDLYRKRASMYAELVDEYRRQIEWRAGWLRKMGGLS